jgi:hypothetical protein
MISTVLLVILAAGLPTYEDFRQADRDRRESGQFQTAKADELTRVDPANLEALAKKHTNDVLIQWGAAELLTNWAQRKPLFEAALTASGTNLALALRYGCVAAKQGDDVAGRWLRYCQQRDPSNAVPWIAVAWTQLQAGKPAADLSLPATATQFRDGGSDAGRARIHALEALGYSAYSARRIGYSAEMPALTMLRDVSVRRPTGVREVATAMQRGATFIITELVGQSVETRWLKEEDATTAAERLAALQARREELQRLVAQVGAESVHTAREREMVEYFNRMLTDGEEAALHWLQNLDAQE